MLNRLTAKVAVPSESAWDSVELRLFVDGQDILSRGFGKGPAADPDRLLGPHSPLIPAADPHEARLAEAECTEGCCGALYVRVSRLGDEIVWDNWRDPDERAVDLERFTFDAREYEAELERAHLDRSWEWPGRTVARLIRERLTADAEPLSKWDCSLDFAESWPASSDHIQLSFTSPPAHLLSERVEHRQYILPIPVTADEPAAQADRIVEQLRSFDPRKHKRSEVRGGYRRPLNPG